MSRHLIVGGDGMIGTALAAALREQGHEVAATSRRDGAAWRVDLAEAPDRWRLPDRVGVAYLCAAVTSLAACEADPEAAWHVNVEHTLRLSRQLAERGARLVLLSTNQVFDGLIERPTVDTPSNPTSAYGRQKAAVEAALAELDASGAAVRLTKVLGSRVELFERWAAAWRRGEAVTAFGDMAFAPVTLDHAAREILEAGRTTGGEARAGWRMVHGSASHDVTYHDAAVRLAESLGANGGLVREGSWRDAGLDPRHVPTFTALDTGDSSAPSPWEAIDAALPALRRGR